MDPLIIMKCTLTGQCNFVHSKGNHGQQYNLKIKALHLRGGTKLEKYEYPYYVGVAHSTFYQFKNGRLFSFYRSHIIVLCVEPFRIVYVGDDIKLDKEIFKHVAMIPEWVEKENPFMYPVSLIMESKDSFLIGAHLNDYKSVLLRLKGMKTLMKGVISHDRQQKGKFGPPPGSLQKHVLYITQNQTKMEFVTTS